MGKKGYFHPNDFPMLLEVKECQGGRKDGREEHQLRPHPPIFYKWISSQLTNHSCSHHLAGSYGSIVPNEHCYLMTGNQVLVSPPQVAPKRAGTAGMMAPQFSRSRSFLRWVHYCITEKHEFLDASIHPSVGPSVRNAFFSMSRLWEKMVCKDQEKKSKCPKLLEKSSELSQTVPKCPTRTHRCPNGLVIGKF